MYSKELRKKVMDLLEFTRGSERALKKQMKICIVKGCDDAARGMGYSPQRCDDHKIEYDSPRFYGAGFDSDEYEAFKRDLFNVGR